MFTMIFLPAVQREQHGAAAHGEHTQRDRQHPPLERAGRRGPFGFLPRLLYKRSRLFSTFAFSLQPFRPGLLGRQPIGLGALVLVFGVLV